MRIVRNSLLIGGACIGFAGLVGLAQAKPPAVHQLRVTLPGGAVETISYTGDVAPKVSIAGNPLLAGGFLPMNAMFPTNSAFAELDRISAAMDRRAALMMRQAEDMTAGASANMPLEAAFGRMPAGGQSYSFVSTLSGNNVCMRSVRVTYQSGKRQVASSSSGNCAKQSAPLPALMMAPALGQPDTLQASAPMQDPTGAVQEVSYR